MSELTTIKVPSITSDSVSFKISLILINIGITYIFLIDPGCLPLTILLKFLTGVY